MEAIGIAAIPVSGPKPVTGWTRFLVGGIGGLAPVVALLIAVDFEKNLLDADSRQAIGYLFRACVLFAVGGFVTWLHETEGQLYKLFEIGIGTPALFAGLITTNSLVESHHKTPELRAPTATVSMFFMSSAHAQDLRLVPIPRQPARAEIKKFSAQESSGKEAFLEGFLGVNTASTYYVISGSHPTYEAARNQADQINAKSKTLGADAKPVVAEVYAPYGGNPYYAVVIGSHLSQSDAKELRSKAALAGLAKDTYLWRPR